MHLESLGNSAPERESAPTSRYYGKLGPSCQIAELGRSIEAVKANRLQYGPPGGVARCLGCPTRQRVATTATAARPRWRSSHLHFTKGNRKSQKVQECRAPPSEKANKSLRGAARHAAARSPGSMKGFCRTSPELLHPPISKKPHLGRDFPTPPYQSATPS